MLKSFRLFLIAAALIGTPVAVYADAIPPQKVMTEAQAKLVGTWQEKDWTQSHWGMGHSQMRRTLIVGNETITISTLWGILPSNEFGTRSVSGTWTSTRKNAKTLVIKLDQGGGRGTELTLVFDGPDAFALSDSEAAMVQQPARFERQGKSPVR